MNRAIVFIFVACTLHAYLPDNTKLAYSHFGFSVASINTLEKYRYIQHPEQYNLYRLKINSLIGWNSNLFLFNKINRFLVPWGSISIQSFTSGSGFIRESIVDGSNHQLSSSCTPIKAELVSLRLNVGSGIEIYSSQCCDIFLLLGYHHEKIDFNTYKNLIIGNSRSVWKGFTGGLRMLLEITPQVSYLFSTMLFPDRITIQSSEDALSEQTASLSYILFQYQLNNVLFYKLNSHAFIGMGLSFSYDRNIGNSSIKLLSTKAKTFSDAQLCYVKSPVLNINFALSYIF